MPRRTRHVALIYDARTVYDVNVMTGVAAYLQESADWKVYIEENALKDQRLPDLRSWRGDGIIANFDDPRVANIVMGSRLPIVAFGSDFGWYKPTPRIPYFVTNNEAIARMGADYLCDRGFVRFAYCGYPRTATTIWSEERKHAFISRLKQRGFPCWCYHGRHKTIRQYDSFHRSLCEWLQSLPVPIGLLAANDSRARHVLEACRTVGLRVPEDVAVLGIDNDRMVCQLSSPPLSSIEQGSRRIGYEAAALLDQIMGGEKPHQTCFAIDPVGLVERLSTDVLAIEDPQIAKAIAFISERACDGIKAQDVADAVGLPRYRLDAAFKMTLGRTLYAEILHFRLERTKRLVASTNLPLKQIAMDVGFRSVQHMSALFCAAFGIPPASYRRTVTASPVIAR
jgi:LacI family transcriptional regulator